MLEMCRMNSDSNVTNRTGYHTLTQYCKDNSTIALAKELKISPEVQTHRAAVYATTLCRSTKSRLHEQCGRPTKQLSQLKMKVHLEKM